MVKSSKLSKNPPNFLIVVYTTIVITSLCLTGKIIVFKEFYLSGCLITFPLLYLFGDVVAEIYGYKNAKILVWYTLISGLIFSVIVNSVIQLPSPNFFNQNIAYTIVFGQDIKYILIAFLAIGFGGLCNIYLITKWKALVQGKYFWLRSFGASGIGELVNSFIAFPLGFTGVLSFKVILNLSIISYIIKMIYTIIAAYPASLLVSYLRLSNEIKTYEEPEVKSILKSY